MGNSPVLKPDEIERILIKLGFELIRQRGSHKQFRHSDGRFTTLPFHKGRDISPILLRQIAKDIGLSVEDFKTSLIIPDYSRLMFYLFLSSCNFLPLTSSSRAISWLLYTS